MTTTATIRARPGRGSAYTPARASRAENRTMWLISPSTETFPDMPDPMSSDAGPATVETAEEGSFFDNADDDAEAQSFIMLAMGPGAARTAQPRRPSAHEDAPEDPSHRRGFSKFGSEERQVDGRSPGLPGKSAATSPPSPGRSSTRRVIFGPDPVGQQPNQAPRKLQKTSPHARSKSLDTQAWMQAAHAPGSVSPRPISRADPTQRAPAHQSGHWQTTQAHTAANDSNQASDRSRLSGVFGSHLRGHQRSSSLINGDALKRLSRALPSISITIPSNIMSSVSTPTSFFSFSSGESSPSQDDRPQDGSQGQFGHRSPRSPRDASGPLTVHQDRDIKPPPRSSTYPPISPLLSKPELGLSPLSPHGQNDVLRPPSALHRVTSDESLLFQQLSPTLSFGDSETRFAHVRGQVNARVKAVMDSWDRPTFKIPQLSLPGILNAKPSDAQAAPQAPGTQRSGLRTSMENNAPVSAFDQLEGDIVVMGGYRGSILRSAQAPHQQLWVPLKVGLNMRKVNLAVGLDPEDEERMEEHIRPSGMLQNMGPVDIARRFFKRLRESTNARSGKLRVHDFSYDWRLSPALISRKIVGLLESLPCNQPGVPPEKRGALVVAHSLGGILTRHAVNMRPDLFSGVIYAGTPQRCINILGPLRNADPVLLNEKILTPQVSFSFRSTFVFLPEDGLGFVDKETKAEIPIDFFDVDNWIKYRLSPCVGEAPLPPVPVKSSTGLGSWRTLSQSLPLLPLRGRSHSQSKRQDAAAGAKPDATQAPNSQTTPPQIVPSSSSSGSGEQSRASRRRAATLPFSLANFNGSGGSQGSAVEDAAATLERNRAYLARTLAETKRFREELRFRPEQRDAYPPFATVYAKDIPTVYRGQVARADKIMYGDAFDDLLFRGGDGVVLAREAMLPPGYELAKGGCVLTDRGHISLLGDLRAMEQALGAVIKGRNKGIGLRSGIGQRSAKGKEVAESSSQRSAESRPSSRESSFSSGSIEVASMTSTTAVRNESQTCAIQVTA